MCLAIVKPAGKDVPLEHLRQGWVSNPDGAGFGYVKDGKAVSSKGFMKLKEFLEAYNMTVEAHPESNFLIHFRICSMGTISEDNTHPFHIENGLLIHNGTLTGTTAKYRDGPSDTKLFADMFKQNLSFDFVQKNKAEFDAALVGSKLAMLYDDNTYQIVNEKDGYWVDGVWYSNHSYRGYNSAACMIDADWEGVE